MGEREHVGSCSNPCVPAQDGFSAMYKDLRIQAGDALVYEELPRRSWQEGIHTVLVRVERKGRPTGK